MKCDCGTEVDPKNLKVGQSYIASIDREGVKTEEVFCTVRCFERARGGFMNRND
jgi:hypothetical protein